MQCVYSDHQKLHERQIGRMKQTPFTGHHMNGLDFQQKMELQVNLKQHLGKDMQTMVRMIGMSQWNMPKR